MGVMKGVWRGAFGVDQLYLGNAVVGLDIQYLPSLRCLAPPLTPCGIRLSGELAIGRDDCYTTQKGWALAKYVPPKYFRRDESKGDSKTHVRVAFLISLGPPHVH